jgi:hypothetical protein
MWDAALLHRAFGSMIRLRTVMPMCPSPGIICAKRAAFRRLLPRWSVACALPSGMICTSRYPGDAVFHRGECIAPDALLHRRHRRICSPLLLDEIRKRPRSRSAASIGVLLSLYL